MNKFFVIPTIVTFTIFIIVLVQIHQVGYAPIKVATILTGHVGVATFVWLVSGFFMQAKDLRQQQDQLNAQHQELKKQAENISVLASNSVFASIDKIMTRYEDDLRTHSLTTQELPTLFLKNTSLMNEIYSSSDPKVVAAKSSEWFKLTAPCFQFITAITTCLALELEFKGFPQATETLNNSEKEAYFLLIKKQELARSRPLRKYSANAIMLVNFITKFKLDLIIYAGLIAHDVDNNPTKGTLLKKDGMEKEIKEFIKRYGEDDLPEIIKIYKNRYLENA